METLTGADIIVKVLDIIALIFTAMFIVVALIVVISRRRLTWWRFGIFFESERGNSISEHKVHDSNNRTDEDQPKTVSKELKHPDDHVGWG